MENPDFVVPTDTASHTPREHAHASHHVDPLSTQTKHLKPRRRARATTHRINVHIPETLHRELEQLSEEEGRTMTEIIRLGLGLVHLATTEKKKGGTLAIIDEHGAIHKVVLS